MTGLILSSQLCFAFISLQLCETLLVGALVDVK